MLVSRKVKEQEGYMYQTCRFNWEAIVQSDPWVAELSFVRTEARLCMKRDVHNFLSLL